MHSLQVVELEQNLQSNIALKQASHFINIVFSQKPSRQFSLQIYYYSSKNKLFRQDKHGYPPSLHVKQYSTTFSVHN